MKVSVFTLWKLIFVLLAASLHTVHAGCSVSLTTDFPDPAPLILNPDGRHDVLGFKRPSPSRHLTFTSGEEVRLVCTGSGNSFRNLNPTTQDIRVYCVNGATFTHDGARREFHVFACSEVPQSTTRRSGQRCNENRHSVYEIGFKVTDGEFFKVIDVCFDDRRLNNVWSKSYVLSDVKFGEPASRVAGFRFTSANLFPGLDPDKLYSKRTQKTNIGRIITNIQANHYINSTYFLSKGLLSDSSNFVYSSQKISALNFANAAPQWETLRVNIWNVMEDRIRNYAHVYEEDLLVYSGTHGVTTLPDVAKTPAERDLYLSIKGSSKQMAVPAIFWKVVYEPISKRGVVMVSINNPHKRWVDVERDPEKYNVCKKKRYISRWYVCASSSEDYGMGYCCEVDDFRNFVKSLPPFEVTDILT